MDVADAVLDVADAVLDDDDDVNNSSDGEAMRACTSNSKESEKHRAIDSAVRIFSLTKIASRSKQACILVMSVAHSV